MNQSAYAHAGNKFFVTDVEIVNSFLFLQADKMNCSIMRNGSEQ